MPQLARKPIMVECAWKSEGRCSIGRHWGRHVWLAPWEIRGCGTEARQVKDSAWSLKEHAHSTLNLSISDVREIRSLCINMRADLDPSLSLPVGVQAG